MPPNTNAAPSRDGGWNAQDRGRTIAESARKSRDSAIGAAKSAAIDSELSELIQRWNDLPAAMKSAVLAIVRQFPGGKP